MDVSKDLRLVYRSETFLSSAGRAVLSRVRVALRCYVDVDPNQTGCASRASIGIRFSIAGCRATRNHSFGPDRAYPGSRRKSLRIRLDSTIKQTVKALAIVTRSIAVL